ncbi:metallophosphoesterase [Nocardia carnea]|uniref:metallophosphoesterase n=1 Tax=Nocardia carnea TaxID=37328 RepID=UPI002453DA61|nr:metallophosphoesterase [Nocardia carnea]
MTGIWFTSDLHIGHIKVAELRGFNTDIHDQVLADRWDRTVGPKDQVWVLGDISAGGDRAETAALEWVAARPGIKHLIAGNHDGCHPLHRLSHRWQPIYLDVFASVQQSAVRRIAGERVLLSHFPYPGPGDDHTDETRYPDYRFIDTGRWLLHGHTHHWKAQRGRQLHVGVDAHRLTPVPLRWVEDRIREWGQQ